ncbi:head-tail connector protein [Mesorhizobium sp. WSM2239]|uniref:Head-tail connector protein n=2 Tax=unclassified Mesorhizobium TaxID=325217 RepID=A0AAU8D2K0_9HYPH
MLRPARTSAPDAKPVSLEEAKAHCRVDHNDDDSVISALIDAAVAYLDGWAGVLGRCIINQGWSVSLCDWPNCGVIRLPFPDVSAATVKYFDTDNVERTVSASLFERLEDERGAFIKFRDDFTTPTVFDDRSDGVRVEFTAGYGQAASDVPAALRAAVLLTIAHWYERREAATADALSEIPFGASALITPYRRVGV